MADTRPGAPPQPAGRGRPAPPDLLVPRPAAGISGLTAPRWVAGAGRGRWAGCLPPAPLRGRLWAGSKPAALQQAELETAAAAAAAVVVVVVAAEVVVTVTSAVQPASAALLTVAVSVVQ